jgi:hypothetical protein
MDGACVSAVENLKRVGARGLPSLYIIEQAPDDSEWTGRAADGSRWKLHKNKRESYELMC